MPRRCSHSVALCLAVTAAWSVTFGSDRATGAPPNVVVILADDLGFSDLGCYGGEIDTPHLDRLAAGGLRFTQGYNTARCWPTRAALLTGYYAQAVHRDALPGRKTGQDGRRPAWARLLPELLASVGYRSYHSGKWHVDGDPRQQGFARSMRVEGGQNDYFDAEGVTIDGQPLQPGADYYVTTAVGAHAVECLAHHAAEHPGVPFFSYIAFTAPHFPLQAPQDLVAKYKDRYRAGWDAVRKRRFERLTAAGIVTANLAPLEPQVGSPSRPTSELLARFGAGEVDRPLPWEDLTAEQREFQATKMAIHAAMVESMDRAVGRIVAQLEAMHALDDTLVLFLSDNGASAEILIRGKGHDPALPLGSAGTYPCLGPGWSSCANTPFRRHKMWVHEGGIATPWIVHWPRGITERSPLRTQPVHVIDVAPTVLELAGVKPPREHGGAAVPPMHGRSFASCLGDPAAPRPHDTLWWCHDGNRAMRVGDWKLVAAKGKSWELYDLATDRCETENLAASEPARVRELEQAWERIAADCRALAGSSVPPAASGAPRQPNIIFILCDDLGSGDVAALGSEDIQTPHIDSLFARGSRLSRHWAGSAVCAPSRCVLLTGKHPGHAAVRSNREVQPEGQFPLPAGTVTLVQLLHDAGYATGGFGKWGLGGPESGAEPLACGFDEFFGYLCQRQAHSYYPDHLWNGRRRVPLDRGIYAADLIAVRQLDFLRRHAAGPFFLYVPTTVPHLALQVPSDEPSLAEYERHFGTEPAYRGGKGYVPCARPLATYAAMITRLDREVGRILALLDELKISDDTILVFTSDNGATRPGTGGIDTARLKSNGPLRDWKGSPYEGGLRVPAVAVWPGKIPAGKAIAAPTGFEDWLPTLLELAGLRDRVPAGLDGVSLAATLRGASAPAQDRVLYRELTEGAWQAATDGRWKLIRRAADRKQPAAAPAELYDLAADPAESRNVAAEHPAVIERMEAILVREHVSDPVWPLPFADQPTTQEAQR